MIADGDAPDWSVVSHHVVPREKSAPYDAAFRQNSLTTFCCVTLFLNDLDRCHACNFIAQF